MSSKSKRRGIYLSIFGFLEVGVASCGLLGMRCTYMTVDRFSDLIGYARLIFLFYSEVCEEIY